VGNRDTTVLVVGGRLGVAFGLAFGLTVALPQARAHAQPGATPPAPLATPGPGPSPGVPAPSPSQGTDAPPAAPATPPLSPPVVGPRPWADGVSEAEQALALQDYERGNAEFVQSRFVQALAEYRRAIAHWDHPAIEFNIAVCLINLGEPLEAREHLERSLAYGAAPLGEDVQVQALTYRKLLDSQLTRVTVRCKEPGAEVSVDGKLVFTGPGEASPYLRPGDHQIVATKPGFLTASDTLALEPGKTTTFDVRLIAFKSATTMVRSWPRWKPYAVVGGGAVVAAIGGLAYAVSASNFRAYDDGIRAACPAGCDAAGVAALPALRDTKDRAELENTIAISLFVVGGAAVVTGAVALYLNQPRAQLAPSHPTAVVSPVPGGATVGVQWGF